MAWHSSDNDSAFVVDLVARKRAADAIAGYLAEELDSFTLDEAIFEMRTKDHLCREVMYEVWYFYSDCKRHKYVTGLDPDGEAMVRRWVVLLRTEYSFHDLRDIWAGDAPGSAHTISFLRSLLKIFCGSIPKYHGNLYWPLKDAESWRVITAPKAGNTP